MPLPATPQTTRTSGPRACQANRCPRASSSRASPSFATAHGVFGGQLLRAQTGDLGPHPGSVGGEEVEEDVVTRVAPGPAVVVGEPDGGFLGAEPGEIHDQEGDVRGDVDLAQRRVELDAVVDVDGASLRHDHVLGAKVAVAVPHQSCARPRIEPGASGGKEAVGEALGGIEPLGVQDSRSRPPEGGQVLLQSVLQNPNVAKLGRRGGRLGVEARPAGPRRP